MPPWIDVPAVAGAQRAVKARARADGERGWYQIRNAASPDEAELLLYDEIGGWFGATADQFVEDLAGITAPSLRVRVNSPGGSVFEGLAIANALRAHPAQVAVQVDGLAASIASVIAMAGDELIMMPNSMLMVHDASGLCMGDAAEMQKMGEVLDLISNNIADVYAAKAGGTRAQWRDTMRAETWYLPEDAVKAGLADQAVDAKRTEPDGDEPEMRAPHWDLTAYGYQGPKQPEAPKPGPPPAATAEEPAPNAPALVISIADVLDEETVAAIRAVVQDRTVEDTASSVHHTATTDVAWDGPAAVAAMPNEESVLRYCHAWYEADGDPDAKASYRFPHHKTKGGPANLAACRNGLARLENSNIPDSDKAGVRRHLQAHLDDADKGSDDAAEDTAPVAVGEPGPELNLPNAATEPEQPDGGGWEALVANLTKPADDWSAAIAHLTNPASSSATES